VTKLTAKQARFVDEYLVDLNATQAAVRAGYSKRTARQTGAENLSKPYIAAAIAERQEIRAERTEVTQDYVVENLAEVVERCMQRAPVMVRAGNRVVQATDEDGNHVWTFDARGAVSALGLLSKHTGGFTTKHEVTGKDGGPIEMREIPDDELQTRATELANRLAVVRRN
jgi:phage terminase small subunit